ncbi:hypothetical protein MPNT_90036 [Candidatus Methylacidithermus pantelleriae]|uniref:Uncharacterized protein n=1 Tax=Candidatus Methylacidithermus pantelleriae TaxID=2744239 RepID=A0A8J2BW45_9BACT|nr:hypothetical protein MPNT_90036 [Candidatus Methylacidithermus pantelleriae]
MRFGFAYREAGLSTQNRSIVVVDPNERTDDMVRDL